MFICRCDGDCEKGANLEDNLNLRAMDIDDTIGNTKPAQAETSRNNLDVRREMGEERDEGEPEQDHGEDDVTDVDSDD